MPINLFESWTVSFFRRWWPYMDTLSVLRYRNARLRVPANPLRDGQQRQVSERSISLRMKQPFQGVICLRENAFDFITFEEVVFEQVYKAIPKFLPRCNRIVDLGANIGLTCLYLAALYPSCTIVAVEPHTENFKLLTKNVGPLIAADRCIPLQAAAWGSDKQLVIQMPEISSRYNAITVQESESAAAPGPGVEGLSVPKIMERSGFDEIDLLKIDIEGAEAQLFTGDLHWLNRVGAIAIEFHHDSRKASNFDSIVQQYGFAIKDDDAHTLLAVNPRKTRAPAP